MLRLPNITLGMFPILFIAMWLFVTTMVFFRSGWHDLQSRYPDRRILPDLQINRLTVTMGNDVAIRGLLSIAVSQDGIRIRINRIFCPLARALYVPWSDVHAETVWCAPRNRIKLKFGNFSDGALVVDAVTWERITSASERSPAKRPAPSY